MCKKVNYCERNFDACLVVIGIKDVWIYTSDVTKFIFSIPLVDRLNVQVFLRIPFSNIYKLNAI